MFWSLSFCVEIVECFPELWIIFGHISKKIFRFWNSRTSQHKHKKSKHMNFEVTRVSILDIDALNIDLGYGTCFRVHSSNQEHVLCEARSWLCSKYKTKLKSCYLLNHGVYWPYDHINCTVMSCTVSFLRPIFFHFI